jgi:hypothetical protein
MDFLCEEDNWTGVLEQADPEQYDCDLIFRDVNTGFAQCIEMNGQNLLLEAYIYLDHTACRWILNFTLYCDEDITLWLGYKDTGLDPTGTYTRITGASNRPTVGVTSV